MTEQQIPKLVAVIVEHQSAFSGLSTKGAQWVIQHTNPAIELMVTAIESRTNRAPKTERAYKILRPVPPASAVSRLFKADETFFNKKSGVKMAPHGSNFIGWFTGKVEEDAPEGILVPFALIQNAYDNEIITDLGGEEKAEVTLSEIWRLMERQANGQDGVLLTNGYANIFYVRDREDVLRAVCVCWRGGGWDACANVLGGFRWRGDRRVFSRNS